MEELQKNLADLKSNGYLHSAGRMDAREAIAKRYSSPEAPLTGDDVVITCGCSGALEMAIGVLVDEGQNMLMPRPGFPLYQTIAESKGASVRHYPLLPETGWEADLAAMEALIDKDTAAIVVNNPSNPCGSVFSREHLLAILDIAQRHKVPIIADEIYRNICFPPAEAPEGVELRGDGSDGFFPLASLTTTVPVLSVGGIAKEFLVPGWRVGWVLVHDRNGAFSEIRDGLLRLSTIILGANSLIQSALPRLLAAATPGPADTPSATADKEAMAAYHKDLIATLGGNASFTTERLAAIPGLRVIVPQGAMYVMVAVDPAAFTDIPDDMAFAQQLLTEENVFVLPGKCFGFDNFFRVVFSAPKEKLAEAYDRIEAFCARHRK